jgi:O-methyltransferase
VSAVPAEPASGERRAAPDPIERDATPADRYLQLLRQCLTRYGLGDDLVPIVPSTPRRRRVWQSVDRLLRRRRIVVLRAGSPAGDPRATGQDWPVHAETMVGLQRLENLQACIDQVLRDGVDGDLLEAGAWRGGTAILMRAVLAVRDDHHRAVWVADSFRGLPQPRAEHPVDDQDLHWTQSYLAVPLAEVRANFERYGLLDGQVRFLPGWFRDTLPVAPIERLAVLRVDGDMYGSTIDVLTALYDKVVPGGYVIVDDYGAIPACRRAVEDFRAARRITEPVMRIDWTGVFWRREG